MSVNFAIAFKFLFWLGKKFISIGPNPHLDDLVGKDQIVTLEYFP